MINLGLAPIKRKDHRTYSLHRTFGSVSPETLPAEFNFNHLQLFPNQNTDGLPNACTAYAQLGVASNEDGQIYDDYDYTYRKTLGMMNAPYGAACDIITSLKACVAWGVKSKSETPDQALCHRRAPFFYVERLGDFFNGILSASWKVQGGITIGTPWLDWFHNIGPDGIVPPMYINPKMKFTEGHDWIAYGRKIINGEERIICVSHQGKVYGNGGECYFSRDQINKLLDIKGSGAFGQKHAEPGDIQTVQMTLIETIISYLYQWIGKLSGRTKVGATGACPTPTPSPTPEPPQPQPQPIKPMDKLTACALAIKDYEGYYAPGENPAYPNGTRAWHNKNAGNLKYAGQKGTIGKDDKGFAIFSDHVAGFNALVNQLRAAANGTSKVFKPTDTFYEFFGKYSPSSDHNNPTAYADYVCKRIALSPTQPISQLLT